jgi:hypothetical protein
MIGNFLTILEQLLISQQELSSFWVPVFCYVDDLYRVESLKIGIGKLLVLQKYTVLTRRLQYGVV